MTKGLIPCMGDKKSAPKILLSRSAPLILETFLF